LEATGGVAEVVVTHLMVEDKLVGQQVLEDMVTGRFLSGLALFVSPVLSNHVFAFLTVILSMNNLLSAHFSHLCDHHCVCVGVIQLRVSFFVVNSQHYMSSHHVHFVWL
jgi:hypothetical protein